MVGKRLERPEVMVGEIVEYLGLSLGIDGLVGVIPQEKLDITVVGTHEDMRHRKMVGSVIVWNNALVGLDEVVDRGDIFNSEHLGTSGE